MAVLVVLGAAGLPLLVALAAGKSPAPRGRVEFWAARAAVAFVLVATVSTLMATSSLAALVGPYDQGTGLVFVIALAGCWALGTGLGPADRRVLITALIAGALVNAIVAIFQQLFGLGQIGISGYQGVPSGLLGNPVHLGALLAGSLALLGARLVSGQERWWAATVTIGIGLGVCGERLPAGVGLAVVIWQLWKVHRARAEHPEEWRRGLRFSGLAVGGLIAGAVLARVIGNGGGLGGHVATSTSSETFGQRIYAWQAALHAIAHRPVFGYGPGQFQAATEARFPLSYWHAFPGLFFTDAHNILIEYATTTGILGLVLLSAWLVLALIGRRGPLMAFALVLVACELAEPLNVANTPLAFLALGAAAVITPPGDRATPDVGARWPRWLWPLSAIFAALALVPAGILIVGDVALQRSGSQYDVAQEGLAIASGSTANLLLAPWPDPAELLSQIQTYLALDNKPGAKAKAVYWSTIATKRNPSGPSLWLSLADAQLRADRVGPARASALRAVMLSPWDVGTNDLLANIALWRHDPVQARYWFGRSLTADAHQPVVREELKGRCIPVPPWQRGFSPTCNFTSR
jgi:O-antigen ligase